MLKFTYDHLWFLKNVPAWGDTPEPLLKRERRMEGKERRGREGRRRKEGREGFAPLGIFPSYANECIYIKSLDMKEKDYLLTGIIPYSIWILSRLLAKWWWPFPPLVRHFTDDIKNKMQANDGDELFKNIFSRFFIKDKTSCKFFGQ